MNASATIRTAYIRASILPTQPTPFPHARGHTLQARPANHEKLRNFSPVDHLQHRQECEKERFHVHIHSRSHHSHPYTDAENAPPSPSSSLNKSFMHFDDDDSNESRPSRLKKALTTFPLRDPIYLVALIFLLGSLDLVINASFDLLPALFPSLSFANDEAVAIPTTVLIGSIFFFVAGVFDTFGALNADRGVLETEKGRGDVEGEMGGGGKMVYKPALLGTPEFQWRPPVAKFVELAGTNLAFQAGLIVLFGGVIFMFAGIVDFPGVVDEESPLFGVVVFGPQVLHGMLFLVANAMLALSEQEAWWKPRIRDADWCGAVLNALGGLGFMVAGLFLFEGEEGRVGAGVAALVGSWAFLVGSAVRMGVCLDVY
ncbi:hypothetical protein K458DRAFT_374581 [Lentithecium fluviatile CBS 122367]|uniref:Uncharacterized protein n=1 Tax=Lentithecium fluviatile CBS 122367 TaxID=1168545 RepID=A0A6G1INP1_9PLEO|nr:hypothetical protein K458DRAFT_374581 [Lentithecium fluviatile CBS 122367]